jgi:2OG-Fe(II) oxygenase superfamily
MSIPNATGPARIARLEHSMTSVYCLDLGQAGLLPSDWQDQVAALAAGPDRQRLIEESGETGSWTFDIVSPEIVTTQLPWLSALYAGPLCRFASVAFGLELVPARRRSSTVTLNILSGIGATNVWHSDQNRVTGVLYASSHAAADGGELEFRDGSAQSPQAGVFVCFAGAAEHQVAPLRAAQPRLALAMTFYGAADAQPLAASHDSYAPPLA